MSKGFLSEREGQIKFFEDLKISADIELTHNTDGVYKGTLFEFKLTISDINKVLFQAIKYLSHRRIKGEPVPAQILLIALNEEKAYLFNSDDFLADIEKIYAGAASKNNSGFSTEIQPEKINFSSLSGLQRIIEILNNQHFTKVHIDVFDVVGWASHYYTIVPKATKSQLFDELRTPNQFKDFIYPWQGKDIDFKYINDLLNAKVLKKELGAFYTPAPYCLKATELVRRAIKQLPKGHDYVILDRCAGTGNLEEFLTDRPVNDIMIGELGRYISDDLKIEYLRDKADVISTFYHDRNMHDITVGELEAYKTNVSLHEYLSDNEISHAIVNTYELKEWIVLNERLGDKVRLVIPPEADPASQLVDGGDALSGHFVLGSKADKVFLDEQYRATIDELIAYTNDEKTNVILLENPPYSDTSADKVRTGGLTRDVKKDSFVAGEFKKAVNAHVKGMVPSKEIANLFIWSGWTYYLKKPDDYFILFSPIKYWKSHNLGERKFVTGFLFNRAHFHAGPSTISCILWKNEPDSREELTMPAFDIEAGDAAKQENGKLTFVKDITVKKVHRTFNEVYFDKRVFDDDTLDGVYCDMSGYEAGRTGATSTDKVFNSNILAYEYLVGYTFGAAKQALTRTTLNARKNGFYLRSDNFVEKLPLLAAKLYPQKKWYERDVYFTAADGGDGYTKDKDFLKACFIYVCLTRNNHCRSFNGSDGRFYKNELCFDGDTLANSTLASYDQTEYEKDLLSTFASILEKARTTENYNPAFAYGTYQIDKELNTRYKNENDEWIYDHPDLNTAINSLRTKLARYYDDLIQPRLFEYELLK